MALTTNQLQTLKADILADPVLAAYPNNADGHFEIAKAYNVLAAVDHWVWKTSLSRAEAVGPASADGTSFSWPDFIARSQGERDAWREMWTEGKVNPSLANVRQGISDIFSGAPGAANRAHLLAVGRRKATRAEKLFASGTGSTGSPAIMGFEGNLSAQDVELARNS